MQIFQWTLPIHVFIFQFNSGSIIAALKFISLNNIYSCFVRASVLNSLKFISLNNIYSCFFRASVLNFAESNMDQVF